MKKQENQSYDIVIVGAGLAGLTAGAYLSRAGYSVLLLEKQSRPGGLVNSFTVSGFTFDGGARSIENSGILKPLIKDLGLELPLIKSTVSIGITDKMVPMRGKESIDGYRQIMEQLFDDRKKDINAIFSSIRKVYREMEVLYGFDNPVFTDYTHDRKYLFTTMLPWFFRFVISILRMRKMQMPVEAYLEKLTDCQSLNDLIAQHFFKNTPMFFALGYFYVYNDYYYPKGGTGKLAEALAEVIVRHRGEILYEVEATALQVNDRTVVVQDGSSYGYERLIWGADLKRLFQVADTTDLSPSDMQAIGQHKESLEMRRGGDSVFTLYIGSTLSPDYFAKKSDPHLFYTPAKEGLGQLFRSELKTLLCSSPLDREQVFAWVDDYCKRTTYEISIPCLRDASLSPEGKSGLIVSFLFEYDLVRAVQDEHWYAEFKEYVCKSMIAVLESSLYPGLSDSIELQFASTPLTIESTFSSSEGGITGWSFEQSSPVVHSLPKIPQSVLTPIPSVYQAGQWAYSPAGIPTAILTGWYAHDAIVRKDKK